MCHVPSDQDMIQLIHSILDLAPDSWGQEGEEEEMEAISFQDSTLSDDPMEEVLILGVSCDRVNTCN